MNSHMYAVRIHLVAPGTDRLGLQAHVLDLDEHLADV